MPKLNIALKTALIATGKKQKRVAKLVGIQEIQLSKIVRGHRPPSEDERSKLAKFLGMSESELFAEEVTA